MIRKYLSSRIAQLRKERKISQTELGIAVSLSQDAVSGLERGYRATTIEKLVEIADFFDVSLDFLTGRTDSRQITDKRID